MFRSFGVAGLGTSFRSEATASSMLVTRRDFIRFQWAIT